MEITKGRSTYVGVKEVDGKIVCENCSKAGPMKTTMHMDGAKFYTNVLQCECGNTVSITTKRSGMDAAHWGD
jgi:hypothetical protein